MVILCVCFCLGKFILLLFFISSFAFSLALLFKNYFVFVVTSLIVWFQISWSMRWGWVGQKHFGECLIHQRRESGGQTPVHQSYRESTRALSAPRFTRTRTTSCGIWTLSVANNPICGVRTAVTKANTSVIWLAT